MLRLVWASGRHAEVVAFFFVSWSASRRNLLLRRKISAAFGAGKHLVRIATVLRIEDATHGAKSSLATFPKIGAFLIGFGHANFPRAILFAYFNDALGLPFQSRCQSVEFDNEHRAGVERKTEIIRRFDGLRDELIHHFQRGG